jgi:DNA mismatch endonuclease Vsr
LSYDFGEVGETRRRTMEAIGSEGTGPERQAAAALDELGVGYEEQVRYGRYRPDFRLEDGSVLQVMGAFWHGHPSVRGMDEVGTNEDYWTPKLRENVERDRRRRRELLTEHGVPYVAWVWEPDPVPRHVEWHCRRLGLVEGTLKHRFWSKVDRGGADECWPWTSSTRDFNRPWFHSPDGWSHSGNRVAYRLWHGRIPEGRHVVHACGDVSCCNPRHLRAEDPR